MLAHLLIADSDPVVLERCVAYFTDRGYQVATASDALQCLDQLRDQPPDILVLQYDLPWGGGDGIIAWLEECSPRWPQTVLLTTDNPQAHQMLASSVTTVLLRPFSLLTLAESIRQAHSPARATATLFAREAERMWLQARGQSQDHARFSNPRQRRT
ncbi:MAG TPA: response regulator [Pirellulales bacterium]|nr:response regulator [Pirellulales bacterium]